LTSWRRGRSPDGDAALAALADIGVVRRLLDQAELSAVRTARRQRKSWAEIAIRLGVTRQSAWEKWRDLDEEAGEPPLDTAAIVERTAANIVRRRASVTVPDVVGMTWADARHALVERGLVAVGADPDAPPVLDTSTALVTDQSPESGARVPPGAPVRLWIDRGGGSGVREPRKPRPKTGVGRAVRLEPRDEAAG
jgi:hypothetical protein